MVKPFDKPLTVEVIDGALNISVGLGVLAFAIKYMPGWEEKYQADPTDSYKAFGETMVTVLEQEEEDGTTLVHLMLDKAAVEALEYGHEGFIEVND